ncbi:MAG TPA: hypothetical protein PKK26_14490, partial [Candidatus Wallbacteria bacterium]|nr:hypothetical protein [Candidatus Wallbacteria bacterium]
GKARIIQTGDVAKKAEWNYIGQFGTGTAGGANNQVSSPSGISYSGKYFYVADTANNRVTMLDQELNMWKTSAVGLYNAPLDIFYNEQGVYVVDGSGVSLSTNEVQTKALNVAMTNLKGITGYGSVSSGGLSVLVSRDNSLVQLLGSNLSTIKTFTNVVNSAGVAAPGLIPSTFSAPTGLASDGNVVYVCDSGNNRILKLRIDYSIPGQHKLIYDPNYFPNDCAMYDTDINNPSYISFDADFVYVSNTGNGNIIKLDKNLKYVAKYPESGVMSTPSGVAVLGKYCVISEKGANRIIKTGISKFAGEVAVDSKSPNDTTCGHQNYSLAIFENADATNLPAVFYQQDGKIYHRIAKDEDGEIFNSEVSDFTGGTFAVSCKNSMVYMAYVEGKDIKFALVTQSGNSSPITIATGSGLDQPSITVDKDNHVFVAWTDGTKLFYICSAKPITGISTVTDDNFVTGSIIKSIATTGGVCDQICLSAARDTAFVHAVWRETNAGLSDIKYGRGSGDTDITVHKVIAAAAPDIGDPKVAAGTASQLYVVWTGIGMQTDIKYVASLNSGEDFSEPINVNYSASQKPGDLEAGYQKKPSIAVGKDESSSDVIMVVWESTSNLTYKDEDVYFTKRISSGNFDPAVKINNISTNRAQTNATIYSTPNGMITFAAWQDSSKGDADHDIYCARYTDVSIYSLKGVYTSSIINLGTHVSSLDTINWGHNTTSNGALGISLYTRQCPDDGYGNADTGSWSKWSPAYTAPGQTIFKYDDNSGMSPNLFENQYVQYRAVLTTKNKTVTPNLYKVTLNFTRSGDSPSNFAAVGGGLKFGDASISRTDYKGPINGWYITPPRLTMSADKEAITYYRWGDHLPLSDVIVESGAQYAYVPFVMPQIDSTTQSTPTRPKTAEGKQTLFEYSMDYYNNAEAEKTKEIWVDTIPPTIPLFSVNTKGYIINSKKASITIDLSGDTSFGLDDSGGYDVFDIDSSKDSSVFGFNGTNEAFFLDTNSVAVAGGTIEIGTGAKAGMTRLRIPSTTSGVDRITMVKRLDPPLTTAYYKKMFVRIKGDLSNLADPLSASIADYRVLVRSESGKWYRTIPFRNLVQMKPINKTEEVLMMNLPSNEMLDMVSIEMQDTTDSVGLVGSNLGVWLDWIAFTTSALNSPSPTRDLTGANKTFSLSNISDNTTHEIILVRYDMVGNYGINSKT